MKKNLMLIAMAFAGGFVSLGSYKMFFDNSNVQMLTAENAPVYTAGYSGLPLDGSLDFTAAAERTVNTVVHVKTQTTAQPVFNPWSDFFGYQQQQPQHLQMELVYRKGALLLIVCALEDKSVGQILQIQQPV